MMVLMPLFSSVESSTKATSIDPDIRTRNYAPLYANFYEVVTPNSPKKYDMPPPITTLDPDAIVKLTVQSQSSRSGKKYRFNPFKKSTTTSKKALHPIRSTTLKSSAISSSTTIATDPKNVPASAFGKSLLASVIQAPFSAVQIFSKPFISVYYLFKSDIISSKKLLKEAPAPKQPPIVTEICQVLASSGIHYQDCNPASPDNEEQFKETTSAWTVEDKNGIKSKQITEGKDQGCIFYLKADPTPLKMSARPYKDGTTDVSYYTKHTVGKYCPKDANDEGTRLFYESLLEHHKPSGFDTFANTKVLFNLTFKNAAELMFLMDAFVLASKRVFSVENYRYWSFRVFLSLYLACFLGYSYYTRE
ncbi:hypothetical protein PS6_004590 [Mucor atramentarius]